MSQARRALVVLISVISVVMAYTSTASARTMASTVAKAAVPSAVRSAPHTASLGIPGYWLVASDGGIFSSGGAAFHGSTGAIALNNPIVGMASTSSGDGYWLVAADGGIFSFGDAAFHGSTGALSLNSPIVGMATTPTGLGYWFVAADGGVFAFGDAHFLGGASTAELKASVVGMAASAHGVSLLPPATQLNVTTNPSNSTGGVAFATQPVVHVLDASGATNTDATDPVLLFIAFPNPGVTLRCTTNPVLAVAGVATFAGCKINTAGSYTLDVTSGSLTPSTTNVTITVGPAAKLGFTNTPSGATSNVALATQPHVAVQDLGGNTVVGNTSSVTLTLNSPGTATLTCTNATPLPAVSGVATFTGCRIDISGSYTLHAADGVLTPANSASLSITAAGATKLAFTTSPTATTGGVAFPTQPVVTVQDPAGNTVLTDASGVTLTITTPNGALLTCTNTTPLTAVNGVATFVGCKINKLGTYTLNATDGVLTPATSASVTISVGLAAKLGFTQQPSASTGGAVFTTQPVVAVQDLGGNTVVGNTSSVTLTLDTPAGAVLTCTSASPLPAVVGVATFTGCKIDKIGTYTLHAADGALTFATSGSLSITVGAATQLAFTTQPSNSTGGVAFNPQPAVAAEDLGGNIVNPTSGSVTLTITTPAGALIACTSANPLPMVAGVATFTGCKIDKAGSYTLHADDGVRSPATSTTTVISVGAAAQLAFTTQPTATTTGTAFPVQPVVKIQDLGGNTVTTNTSSVTLTLTTPGTAVMTCTSATPLPAVSGVATFVGCAINVANTYTLNAADTGLSPATSSPVVIS